MTSKAEWLAAAVTRAPGVSLALLVACSAGCGQAAEPNGAEASASCGPRVTVSDSAKLQSALNNARDGQVIELMPGEYVLDKVQDLKFARGVTVTSADPVHPAVLDGIYLQDSTGLTFRDLEVKVDPRQKVGALVLGGGHINLEALDVYGTGVGKGLGLRVMNASNVTLANLNVHDLEGGIAIVNTDTVSVLNSNIHDLEVDGILSAGSAYVTISGNRFTNFFPQPGDHSDAIQFFTFGTTKPTHDLTITDNTYVRGRGIGAQGIFMNNEAGIPYENVTISGNAIIGGVYHGIAIALVDHLNLTHNLVEGYVDQTSWILIDRSTHSSESDNISTNYNYTGGNADLVKSGNKTVRQPKVGDISMLADRAPPPKTGPGAKAGEKSLCGS
jgi:nitrous oxidase accessory protein NosD